MQAADLIKYINDPHLLDKDSVKQLQKLVDDFPYFQSAHTLLSMASRKWDASVYQQSLKKTAIVSTNRAHLFKLIHDIENEAQKEPALTEAPEIKTQEVQAPVLDTHREDARQELDILKATEISMAEIILPVEEPKMVEPEKTEGKVLEKKPVLDAEQILEREIAKEVVNSFVEKEILKTPEFNKPGIKQESPENFTDWLSFLKKNNGQTYQEIKVQLSQEKAKQDSAKASTTAALKEGADKELTKTAEVQEEKAPVDTRKLKNKAIIDKIIENSPGLIRQKEEQRFYAPDIKAKESLLENEHLVTETLAKIYALQGSVSKAIRAYEILSLKHPQKRAYFDGLIQKLKSNG